MISRARLVGLAVGISAICGLAACAASPSPAPSLLDVDGIDLQDYRSVTARLDFDAGRATLPDDSIDHVGPEFEQARRDARHAIIDSCLAELGLPPYAWSTPPAQEMDDRLYGSWSVSFASHYGFSSSSEEDAPPPRS